jgi:hypothetical protein
MARDADGEVVWSWRLDAGVKLAGSVPPMTVARKPDHRGDHDISRKTIAQGRPECLRWTCMLVCVFFAQLHTRPRVQRAPGLPCALNLRRAGSFLAHLGQIMPRDREAVFANAIAV